MHQRPFSSALSLGFSQFLCVVVFAVWGITLSPTQASVIFSASGLGNDAGETNSASAEFELSISGTITNLIVTLSNTAGYTPNDNPDILTAVFFTIAADPTLTRISGVLNAGSVAVENGTNLTVLGGDIGGSWTYKSGLVTAPGGANQGISSAGFTIFGPGDVFPGAALPDDAVVPDGIGGGLTTTVDGGTSDGLNGRPFIQYSAVFTLGAVPAAFTLTDISGVNFQYGTGLDEPNIPEPSTITFTLGGVALLALLRRKRC